MKESLNYVKEAQLDTRDIVRAAFLRAYGYDVNGSPIPGIQTSELPAFRDQMIITRDDIYEDVYWTAQRKLEFFANISVTENNQVEEIVLSDQKARVLTGLRFQQVTTAAADTGATGRNPVAVAHEELLNAKVTVEINNRTILRKQRLGDLAANATGEVAGMFYFPNPEVVKPSEAVRITVDIPANAIATHEWLRISAVGFKLQAKN